MLREKTCLAVIAASAVLFVSAGAGMAQIATPPPPPEPEGEPYIPPPPPPPPRPVTTRPANGDTPATSGVTTTRRHDRPMRQVEVPNIPYEPLGSPDLEGNMPNYRTALDLPALKHNPTIPQSKAGAVLPIAQARAARVELRLIENLDLLYEIENGKADQLLDKGVSGLMELNSLIAPLVEEDSLTTELFKAGVLSDMQARSNQKIINEFNRARRDNIAGIQDQNEQIKAFMQLLLEDSLLEVLMTQRSMALESLTKMDKVLDTSGLAGTEQGKALAGMELDTLPADEIVRDGLASKVLETLNGMSTEQRAAFFKAVRSTRENPEVPPYVVVDLDIHYKKDMTGVAGDHPIKQRDPEKTRKQVNDEKAAADKAKAAEDAGDDQ